MSAVLLVVAKAPVPGQVKTRLRPALSAHQAAAVAAAALLDTLDAVRAAATTIGTRPVLALSGDLADGAVPDALTRAVADFRVVPQRGETFAERLVAAHLDAAQPEPGEVGTVQIGMDTPQVTAAHLLTATAAITTDTEADAVLGPAEDGGWWLLGLRRASDATVLADVPMSVPTTGQLTLDALRAAGLRTELTDVLRDVDHPEDLRVVAGSAADGRFSRLVGVLDSRPAGMIDPVEAYEHGLCCGQGRAEWADGTIWELPIPDWKAEPDLGDLELLARCQGPTLDVGCGPGRLTAELAGRGLAALGLDISELAVAMTRARGGSALQHDVFSRQFTPQLGHRRWRHVILADGNVGIGGDPLRLLWRCRELVESGGSVLLDLDPPGVGLRSGRLRMMDGEDRSHWFGWAWLGVDALEPVAAAAGLRPVDVWSVPAALPGAAPRWQAELERTDVWPSA